MLLYLAWLLKNGENVIQNFLKMVIWDYTDLLHLIILNNLENTNAELIRMNIKQSDRLIRLNESARNQMEALKNNKNIKELEVLQQQVNENNKYLIESKQQFPFYPAFLRLKIDNFEILWYYYNGGGIIWHLVF